MLAHAGRVGRDSGGSCCSDSGAALKRKRPPLLEVDASISSWAPTLAQLRPHLHRRHSAPDGWKPDLPNVPADTGRGWPAPLRTSSDTHTDDGPSALLVYVDRDAGDTDRHVDGRCSALTALSAMSLDESRAGGNAESLLCSPRTSMAMRRVSSERLLWPPQALDLPSRWVPGT